MYKSVNKEKIRIILIFCVCRNVNKNNQRYYRREHAGHKPNQVSQSMSYLTSGTFNMSKHCKNN